MWPRMKFNPVDVFDLHVQDLVVQDPYFVRILMTETYPKLGEEAFIGLLNAPEVVDYLCEVCPEQAAWLRRGMERMRPQSPERVREAEARLVEASLPWNLGMAKSPETWDSLPWSFWDPSAIYDRVDLRGKTVLDIGAGTGQVTLRCAPYAGLVWALEPVARLRHYIERKMSSLGFRNVRTLDGLIEAVPLEDASVDAAILSNGSFGWNPAKELLEIERILKPGGVSLMLGPCNHGSPLCDTIRAAGYEEFEFEVPGDGMKPAFIKRV